jgi:hypothetical protein
MSLFRNIAIDITGSQSGLRLPYPLLFLQFLFRSIRGIESDFRGVDPYCLKAMKEATTRTSRFVRFELEVQSMLIGRPGARQRFQALIIPPFDAVQ